MVDESDDWKLVENMPDEVRAKHSNHNNRLLLFRRTVSNNYYALGHYDLDLYSRKPKPYWSTTADSLLGLRVARITVWTHYKILHPPARKEGE